MPVDQSNLGPEHSLARLAYNLRWAWHAPTADLFQNLAPEAWEPTRNPVAVVNRVTSNPTRLRPHAEQLASLEADLDAYLGRPTWTPSAPRVAYFSAEFAVAECLPIYSGGLGILAGDHLKAASDLGVPMIGVGLLYRYGYFRQIVDANGQQREAYDRLDLEGLPVRPVMLAERVPLEVGIPFPGRTVVARAWLAQVGRVRLYLLDTDLPRNREDDRWITGHLYGGDSDTRLRQEMVLGIGGVRLVEALRMVGVEVAPEVYHLNEGHSAFAAVERAAGHMRRTGETDFFRAHQAVAHTLAFTTHTPVAAGHDAFPAELIEAYLGEYRQHLGLTHDQFMSLGRDHRDAPNADFSMTVLALRSAHARGAVSQLHGQVSRGLWSGIGTGVHNARPRIEMAAITNGVHTATWAGPDISAAYDRFLSWPWRTAPHRASSWARLTHMDSEALWAARSAQRARLLDRLVRAGCSVPERPLVIGFARRFATYKRAGLLLEDPERLARLLGNPERPVLVVFAGKAHPKDEPGKRLVQRVVEASRDARFAGRIAFLADYDVELARLLVQGSDVWLNTPQRPMEASGTSGMKATLNGALHLSELDGWWDEAYEPCLGWALGEGVPDDASDQVRDAIEAAQLMDLLEGEIVPLFFERDAHGVPAAWLERVKTSIATLAARYSAHRMLTEYVGRIYYPLARSVATSSMDLSDEWRLAA